MLRADAVSFGYDTVEVLRRVSIGVQSGGLTGVLGPNGSGKTTRMDLSPGGGKSSLAGTILSRYRGVGR